MNRFRSKSTKGKFQAMKTQLAKQIVELRARDLKAIIQI